MGLSKTDFLITDKTNNDDLFLFRPDGVVRARGYVERDFSAYPKGFAGPPSEIKTIPRSEWSARIKEMEETKSRLSDLRGNIPSLDQKNFGYCATADTEILTEKGFIPWPEYKWDSLLGTINQTTGELEYQSPTERHVYDYDGEMVYSTNKSVDFGMTPDHRLLLRKWVEKDKTLSDEYTFQRTGDIGWYAGLMHAPKGWRGREFVELEVEGDQKYSGDDFIALVALIVSDGYGSGSKNDPNLISFCCFKQERYPMVASLANKLGFSESSSRKGVWSKRSKELAKWVREHCYTGLLGAKNKRIPEIVKASSMRQIELFLKYFGDRNHSGAERYYSSSKTLIDDLQHLLLKVGRRGTVTERGPRTAVMKNGKEINSDISYTLIVRTDSLSIERKHHIERERYKGPVFCATVPNGTLITRRNGTMLISGNCWSHSSAHAAMLSRVVANQPYVPLSAYSVAATIKNGRNEGGWCGLSMKFMMEKGIAPQSVWPQGNISKRWSEVAEEALKYKTAEQYYDISKQEWGQSMTFDQVATCLLLRIPLAIDYNWWGHSVCGMDLVEVSSNSFGVRILNSWSDSWGDRGAGVLEGSKAIPDGAVGIRVMVA